MKSTFWKVWGIPVIIGICSALGLLSALTGDGFYDLLSWLTLGLPVVVTIWFLVKMKRIRQTVLNPGNRGFVFFLSPIISVVQ